jgi:hypothetical protein
MLAVSRTRRNTMAVAANLDSAGLDVKQAQGRLPEDHLFKRPEHRNRFVTSSQAHHCRVQVRLITVLGWRTR